MAENDELHMFAFNMHCAEVYDMLCEDNARQADGLFYSDRFWTVEWQTECRQRQREKLFCHLESLCSEIRGSATSAKARCEENA